MSLLGRLLLNLIAAIWRPAVGMMERTSIPIRIWPHDLDLNLHANNGRILTISDVGRLDMAFRAGLMVKCIKRGWKPVVASTTVRYRKSLMPFRRYDLQSRVLTWDEKWVYFEHRFVRKGEVAVVIYVRGGFVGRNGVVPPAKINDLMGLNLEAPEHPEWLRQWQLAENGMREAI
ncbi:MAG: thioesterase family protein [Alphaproteobacteria bacterium]|jgi:acyl-CoA thioesterase FadM|nr:thioesterase family protein [Alphaproteobacteria bacterium]MBT4083875.1 thioesterase family protein [Alphaproteobacteria bacterium]MBT4546177.1 thioesterase family protein [Alphaproteobacteria bacterium]MBT7747601.1 thioesterase family protein [Alphaproteobacteria bacterium]